MNFEDYNYESFNKYILVDPTKQPEPDPNIPLSGKSKTETEQQAEAIQAEMVGFALPAGQKAH